MQKEKVKRYLKYKEVWPWSTKWSRAKANRVFCQENMLVIVNTLFQQHKRWLYTWTSPDSQSWNQIDYIFCSQRQRSSVQSTKTRLGDDCASDHEVLIGKFRLKLKKTIQVWLKSNPYDYTVEVTNRFKGLDLMDRVPEELWTKTIPKKKKCNKAKWLSRRP